MTEFEYLSLITQLGEAAAYHSMNFITLLFAYILVAYFAGRQLSNMQIWLTTGIYSTFLLAPVTANIRALDSLSKLGGEFSEKFPQSIIEFTVIQQRPYFLMLLYFVVLGPFAIFYRLVADPLRISRPRSGNWMAWASQNETLRMNLNAALQKPANGP